jgi:Fe-S-cluster containining protein
MCGNCCTGPEGYVLVSSQEADALSRRLGLTVEEFLAKYTHLTIMGPSLTEVPTPFGLDCVFLDRAKIPGKAVCGVYEDRPAQCRTWPFWKSNLNTRAHWDRASRTCPGINTGTHYSVQQIRVQRGKVEI